MSTDPITREQVIEEVAQAIDDTDGHSANPHDPCATIAEIAANAFTAVACQSPEHAGAVADLLKLEAAIEECEACGGGGTVPAVALGDVGCAECDSKGLVAVVVRK